jgi:hypothetical protein
MRFPVNARRVPEADPRNAILVQGALGFLTPAVPEAEQMHARLLVIQGTLIHSQVIYLQNVYCPFGHWTMMQYFLTDVS